MTACVSNRTGRKFIGTGVASSRGTGSVDAASGGPRLVKQLLDNYYHPYHHRLSTVVPEEIRLCVDCHTMAGGGTAGRPGRGRCAPARLPGQREGRRTRISDASQRLDRPSARLLSGSLRRCGDNQRAIFGWVHHAVPRKGAALATIGDFPSPLRVERRETLRGGPCVDRLP